jgi:hypothetical protein
MLLADPSLTPKTAVRSVPDICARPPGQPSHNLAVDRFVGHQALHRSELGRATVGASTDEFVLVMGDLHQWNRVDVDREAGR